MIILVSKTKNGITRAAINNISLTLARRIDSIYLVIKTAAGKNVIITGYTLSDNLSMFMISPIQNDKAINRIVTTLPKPAFPSFKKAKSPVKKVIKAKHINFVLCPQYEK